jgi:3D (Asp-Asp-Asp) domain-containing protein
MKLHKYKIGTYHPPLLSPIHTKKTCWRVAILCISFLYIFAYGLTQNVFAASIGLLGTSVAFAGGRGTVLEHHQRIARSTEEGRLDDENVNRFSIEGKMETGTGDPCELKDVYCEKETVPPTRSGVPDSALHVSSFKGKKVQVTGYTSHIAQTDSTPCIAADGSDICKRYAKGEKICATNDWKLGTRLIIEGLGTCTVADRMNKRYTGTNRVDFYYGYDIMTARRHGVQSLYVQETNTK